MPSKEYKLISINFKLSTYNNFDLNKIKPEIIVKWYTNILAQKIKGKKILDLCILYDELVNKYVITFKTNEQKTENIIYLIKQITNPDSDKSNPLYINYNKKLRTNKLYISPKNYNNYIIQNC
jgi:hypothetical protein